MIQDEIKKLIKKAIKEAQKEKKLSSFDIPEIEVTRPADEKFGDWSTNIAMRIKSKSKSVEEVGQVIAESMPKNDLIEKVEAVSGFINFTLAPRYLTGELSGILKQKDKYGSSNLGKGKKVQVEFISANPTGPLTLGNGRGGFAGDTLANILEKAGYKVQREYYINDQGNQVETLGYSILASLGYVGKEKETYKGRYIEDLARQLEGKVDLTEAKPLEIGKEAAKLIMKKLINKTVEKMRIKFDNYFNESSLFEKGNWDIKVLEKLKKEGLIYEKEGAVWFKGTSLADSQDQVLYKSDGQPTYFLSDIAYHLEKFQNRKFDKVIDFWGADHTGHVKRLKVAMSVFGFEKNLEIIVNQLVRLVEEGKEVKMSKRAGVYVTLDELLEEIPLDVCRFFFLMHAANTHMDFDLKLAREKSEKNPVYYVQYAFARLSSILRRANSKLKTQNSKLSLLTHSAEIALIKELIKFPELVEEVSQNYQVHKLPYYTLSLADKFHNFYEKCRVLNDRQQATDNKKQGTKNGEQLTGARLALLKATKIVLKNALDLMGVKAPEKM